MNSSSAAVPPLGLPKRTVPGNSGLAPPRGEAPPSSPWPLRKPVSTPADAVPPAGKRGRKQGPEAAPPEGADGLPPGAGAQPPGAARAAPPRPSRGLPSEKGNARPNIPEGVPDDTSDEIPILPPAGLNPQQPKTTGKVPPPMAARSQAAHPASGFPFPDPKNGNAPPNTGQQLPPTALPTGPSGPIPPPLNPNRRQPPIPESLRPGPPGSLPPQPGQTRPGPPVTPASRAEQSIPEALRPGMARQGQGPGLFPKQPGPAPSGPVPMPVKSPQRKNTPVNNTAPGDPEHPPPLRLGNMTTKTQQKPGAPVSSHDPAELIQGQKGVPPTATDPSKPADPNRPAQGPAPPNLRSPPGATGPFPRKPVNQNPAGGPPKPPTQMGAAPGSLRSDTNPLRAPPRNAPPQQGAPIANQENPNSKNPFRPAPSNVPGQKGTAAIKNPTDSSLQNLPASQGNTTKADAPGSSPPNAHPQQGKPASTNPFRSEARNAPAQQGTSAAAVPFKSSPPNPLRSTPQERPSQPGNQPKPNPSVYRPSVTSPPPRGQTPANVAPAPVANPPRQQPPAQGPPPRVTSPPGFSGARPAPTHAGPNHGPSNSMDSDRSMGSSRTATSTQPLNNPPQRQNTGFNKPTRQDTHRDPREKGSPGGGGYYSSGDESGSGQSPYMNMLLSLDRIPRLHNILILFFVWILLAGFVIIPGSFTSAGRRPSEGESAVQIPVASATEESISLTGANTAAMVIGFVCILTGLFGSAWLALRWRRNYVWLLNKLYMPLILNALVGLIATITSVYTQQDGEWSPQAIVIAIVEGSVLVLSAVLFFIYNYWLLQKVRSDHEQAIGGDMDDEKKKRKKHRWGRKEKKEKKEKKKREKKEKKRGGLFARFRHARSKPPVASGSVV